MLHLAPLRGTVVGGTALGIDRPELHLASQLSPFGDDNIPSLICSNDQGNSALHPFGGH